MSDFKNMQLMFKKFLKERDWEKFHNPKDIAIGLSVEANELLELFQWKSPEELPLLLKEKNNEIKGEVADIMHFLIAFSIATDIDLYEEFVKKLEYNEERYPKELVKGKAHKYTYYEGGK